MSVKLTYGLIYLLVSVSFISAGKLLTKEKSKERKQLALGALALSELLGPALAALGVGAAAVAGAGALSQTLTQHKTETDHDSHNCYNNRGWCRYMCRTNERVVDYAPGICGDTYDCCVDKSVLTNGK